MAALQFAEIPGYKAILLRRTLRMLDQDDGLIRRARDWLTGKATYREQKKRWDFPSGASLAFGYLDNVRDLDNYQGGAWHFIGLDELTQFPEEHYRYLFSRQRRLEGSRIPLRMRSASNPGNLGHEWVKKRFISSKNPKFFVPALLKDNPGLDAAEYVRGMIELDPITRAQLLAGDWDAYQGGRFKKEWFREFRVEIDAHGVPRYYLGPNDEDGVPVHECWNCILCDPACTEDDLNDPTAIGVFAVTPGRELLILDMFRERIDIDRIPEAIAKLCAGYNPLWVGIEDNGFAVGITRACQRHRGIPAVKSLRPEGKGKLVRATPAIIRCEMGQIFVPENKHDHPWLEEFIAECVQFTGDGDMDAHDDQVDVLAYAVQAIDRLGLGGPLVVEPQKEEFAAEEDETAGGMFGWGR